MLFLTVLFSNLITANAANDDKKIAFISNHVEAQNKPTTLILWHDCFNSNQKLNLVKSVFTYTMFVQQDSLNETSFRQNPHHNLYITDFTCTSSPEKIIAKVNSMISKVSLLVCDSISILSSSRSTLCFSRIHIGGWYLPMTWKFVAIFRRCLIAMYWLFKPQMTVSPWNNVTERKLIRGRFIMRITVRGI